MLDTLREMLRAAGGDPLAASALADLLAERPELLRPFTAELAGVLAGPPDDARFAQTRYVVEATSCEVMYLWRDWADDSPTPLARIDRLPGASSYAWRQDNPGLLVEAGILAAMPVCISAHWVLIDGVRVMFYEDTSAVVDMRLTERWLEAYCNPLDPAGRPARCNAMNFHHCLEVVRYLRRGGGGA